MHGDAERRFACIGTDTSGRNTLGRELSVDHDHEHEHDDDIFNRGLQFDLATLLQRRRVLGLIAGVGAAGVAGVAAAGPALAASTESAEGGAGLAAACSTIPTETGGPFPGDGSNG